MILGRRFNTAIGGYDKGKWTMMTDGNNLSAGKKYLNIPSRREDGFVCSVYPSA